MPRKVVFSACTDCHLAFWIRKVEARDERFLRTRTAQRRCLQSDKINPADGIKRSLWVIQISLV
jgi:hypothetical protein